MDQLYGGTLQEIVPDLHSLRMSPPAVEKRHDFIEHIRGCHQGRQRSHNTLPVPCGRLMRAGHWQFRAPKDNRYPQTLHSSVVEIPIMVEGGILHIEDDWLR